MTPRGDTTWGRTARLLAGQIDRTEIVDVWSHTKPKYRRRAVLLLLLNAGLFVGLCWFTFWLRTGEVAGPFGAEDYGQLLWRSFDPVGEHQVTLSDFLLFPLSIEDVPLQIVVVGLLLASLISIPILVAILYRFPFSLLFFSIVAFVALMPWLAITLTLSCLIAAIRPLKFSFRYVYALIALIPVVIYLFLNPTRWSPDSLAGVSPEARVQLYAPFVLAVLASCVVMALVLLVARIVNYRPGAIAPLLAIMFAIPWALFQFKVGPDELDYRLLERECGPGSIKYFADHDANELIDEVVRKMLEDDPDPLRDREALRDNVRLLIESELDTEPLYRGELFRGVFSAVHDASLTRRTVFAKDQHTVVLACKKFLSRHPQSRYRPNVLYLQGRAIDMRVDITTFKRTGVVKHYDQFPSQASTEVWAALADARYGQRPVRAVALHRLAQLEAREGKVDSALRRLDTLVDTFTEVASTTQPSAIAGWRSLFTPRKPAESLRLDVERIVREARKLRELITNNRDPVRGDLPLAELFRLNPLHARYAENLDRLIDRFPNASLIDNLEVRRAASNPSLSLRVEGLEGLVDLYAGQDGARIGWFYLAQAYLQDKQFKKARQAFDNVIRAGEQSVWADEARREREMRGL